MVKKEYKLFGVFIDEDLEYFRLDKILKVSKIKILTNFKHKSDEKRHI